MSEDINETSLAHDFRELNKVLKPSLERISDIFRRNRNHIGTDEKHAITARFISEMMTKRLDVYDFYKNKASIKTSEQKYAVHRVLMKIVKFLEYKLASLNVRISVSESTVEIRTSSQFEVALFVLMENCVKYSPRGETVDVTISQENERGAEITFQNYGPQLDDSEIPRVFEMGFRGEKAKKYEDGSGIGLHFAKSMCDLHGFDITLTQNRSCSISKDGFSFAPTLIRITIPLID